jgi:hypothetical protein
MTDNEKLLERASDHAGVCLEQAIKKIDALLGSGYAKKHPELTGAFMQVLSGYRHVNELMRLYKQLHPSGD